MDVYACMHVLGVSCWMLFVVVWRRKRHSQRGAGGGNCDVQLNHQARRILIFTGDLLLQQYLGYVYNTVSANLGGVEDAKVLYGC